jgi:azurin
MLMQNLKRTATRRSMLVVAIAMPVGYLFQTTFAATARKKVNLSISTDGDLLAFKPDRLSCPAGAYVHLTFHHMGKYVSQDHDWVLTRPGTADAVARAALESDEKGGWDRAKDPRILAATPLCSKGHSVSVDFIAPAPGDYPFLCTTPGHGAVMHGVLHVTPN